MKFLLALVVVVAVAQAEFTADQKAKFSKAYESCLEKTGVNVELIKKMRSEKEFAEDEKLKQYIECMFEKLGFYKNGEIQADFLKSLIPEGPHHDSSIKAIDTCKELKIPFDMYKCYQTTAQSPIKV